MSGLSFPIDNSTQLPQSSFTSGTPTFEDLSQWTKINGSNLYNTSLGNIGIGTTNPNGFKLNVNGTLNASSFTGVGSSISTLDYNKITLNKPTNFPTDWNTTISNKPSFFPTDWNTTISNKPSTFPADMTNIYNKTEVNTISNNNSNYTSNTSNILSNLINTNSNYTTITSNILNTKIDVNNINISNILYNPNYTDERQYPPKLYNSASGETSTTEIFNKTTYKQTLTLNTSDITYGFGEYTIYSSSIWGTNTFKEYLFDYNTTNDNPHWLLNNYTTSTGLYSGVSTNFIINDYIGDWIIVKLPNTIILTKFNFYARLTNGCIVRAPSLWRCYGSNDGITFTEITEASNTNALTTNSYTNGLYTKSFNNLISYIYIGFVFSKIIGGDAVASTLNFSELQLFGKEQLILPVYISSNVFNSTLTNTSNTLKSFIDTKENILTFSSPLTRTTNTIGINLGSYSTTGNDTNYLLKTGGTMTGAISGATTITAVTDVKSPSLVLYNSANSNYQLLVSGPSDTGPASIQTVQQGVNFNQNIVFQNSGGNVGIGTTANITEKLFVNGNVKATNLIASTRITAEGDIRSPNFTAYNSAATNYEIYMTAPSATLPATIQTIQQGANFNQSLTIQATGTGTVSIGTTSVGTYKLNVNGSLNATTIWQNGTQIDFNSYFLKSGGTITNNLGIGTSPLYQTHIHISSYNNKPLLTLSAGIAVSPYGGTARNIGQPLLGIGENNFTGLGDYFGIGFGYKFSPNDKYCCEIGCVITDIDNAEKGDLLFSTRNTTGQPDVAIERMRITTAGNITIGSNLNSTTYKLNVDGSINSTTLWQNGTQLNTLLNAKQNTLTFNSPLSLTGNTLSFNESAITTLTNFYNKTTSDGIYVKIQSDTFVKKSGDTITGSLIVDQTIYGNNGINIVGNYVGSINVAKRATFAFVPVVNLSRRQYVLPLTYINGNGSGYGTQYIFRVHVWTSTGDFGASGNDVETMSYFVFLSPFDGMKIRIETIYNNSNGSLIQSHTATSLLYNGASTVGGASEKYCVIENISGY